MNDEKGNDYWQLFDKPGGLFQPDVGRAYAERGAGYKVLNNNWYPYYYLGTTNRYNLW
jgi:hypothetical protein